MVAIGCNGGMWGWNLPPRGRKRKPFGSNSKSFNSAEGAGRDLYCFPLKQAGTAGALAFTGDTIAQISERWRGKQRSVKGPNDEDVILGTFSVHDWLRALRMTSYGFLFYGPGSYAWYRYLDHCLPELTVKNITLKVLLNQIVLGPCVIAVVFAWNNLWQGKLSELPKKYQRHALPTLFNGFRFWIPVSMLNFWVVPLQARVAFMSMGSIFWNFYLSSTMSK